MMGLGAQSSKDYSMLYHGFHISILSPSGSDNCWEELDTEFAFHVQSLLGFIQPNSLTWPHSPYAQMQRMT